MLSAPRTSFRSSTRFARFGRCRLRNTRLLAGVLFALLLDGCALLDPLVEQSLAEARALPAQVELVDTPFYPQRRYQCGPAALATVLNAWGTGITPATLTQQVYLPARKGSLPEEMSASARRNGMLAYPLQPSLADLLRELAAGHPVLVFQNLGLTWLPRLHYAVAIGYDLDDRTLLLRSGTTRRWRTNMDTFLRTWARTDDWALVILPPGTMPASARLVPYLQAAQELEATAGPATALPALQAATRHWPDDPLSWLALGNNLYSQQDGAGAEQSFRQAIQLQPRAAEAWNNLAYALLQHDCPQQALRAVHCAEQLDASSAYRDSAREIRARSGGTDQAGCMPVNCPLTAPPVSTASPPVTR